jgi:nitroimidazol reductase NimA-like FMN-containing flavoprotein (pyridoxamine 5'-phosphate oxidase superfamily)
LKLDFIQANNRVCATVVEDRGYQMGKCAHAYRSVVFWGKMTILEELEEKKHGMEVLLNHLETNPDPIRKRLLSQDEAYNRVGMIRLDIEEIVGKKGE